MRGRPRARPLQSWEGLQSSPLQPREVKGLSWASQLTCHRARIRPGIQLQSKPCSSKALYPAPLLRESPVLVRTQHNRNPLDKASSAATAPPCHVG